MYDQRVVATIVPLWEVGSNPRSGKIAPTVLFRCTALFTAWFEISATLIESWHPVGDNDDLQRSIFDGPLTAEEGYSPPERPGTVLVFATVAGFEIRPGVTTVSCAINFPAKRHFRAAFGRSFDSEMERTVSVLDGARQRPRRAVQTAPSSLLTFETFKPGLANYRDAFCRRMSHVFSAWMYGVAPLPVPLSLSGGHCTLFFP